MRRLLFVCLLFISCESQKDAISLQLTNNSCKFWYLKHFINLDDNQVIKKKFQVIKICKNGDFFEYKLKNDLLLPVDFSDNIPENKWKLVSETVVKLNNKKYNLKRITRDTLILVDNILNRQLVYTSNK